MNQDFVCAQSSPEVMRQRLQLLGGITWLMLQSPQHWHCTIEELEVRILPSLTLNQFRYYEVGDQPIGFIGWAYLPAEAEEKYQTGGYKLRIGIQHRYPSRLIPSKLATGSLYMRSQVNEMVQAWDTYEAVGSTTTTRTQLDAMLKQAWTV